MAVPRNPAPARTRLAALTCLVVLVGGCGASSSAPAADSALPASVSPEATASAPTASAAASAPTAPTGTSAAPAISFHSTATRPDKVLVVIEENHSQRSALAQMPYLASLSKTYGRTSSYKAVTHPSLPNYLAIIGGSTFGVKTNLGPDRNAIKGPSILDTAIAAGKTAKTYAEGMPSNCYTGPKDPYAVKHNPWAYFTDATSRANCRQFDVPSGTPAAGALRSDIDAGTLPNLGLLIPDLCHDGHDCSLKTADDYLKSWLTRVLAGPDYASGRLAVIVTFDEDDTNGDNTVLTTVVSPRTRGVVSDEPFTHYSLARYLSQLIKRTPPGQAAGAPQLRPAFGI